MKPFKISSHKKPVEVVIWFLNENSKDMTSKLVHVGRLQREVGRKWAILSSNILECMNMLTREVCWRMKIEQPWTAPR